MLTDDGYRQLMKHAKRLAQEGHGELAQHLRDAIDLRAEVEALRADAERYRWLRDGSNPPWVMQMLERYADNGSDFDAEVDAARAPQQAEPVVYRKYLDGVDAHVYRLVPRDDEADKWEPLYLHPPAAEVQRLRDALKPFAAIDLTTNQAVDAMDVLRARRALGAK